VEIKIYFTLFNTLKVFAHSPVPYPRRLLGLAGSSYKCRTPLSLTRTVYRKFIKSQPVILTFEQLFKT